MIVPAAEEMIVPAAEEMIVPAAEEMIVPDVEEMIVPAAATTEVMSAAPSESAISKTAQEEIAAPTPTPDAPFVLVASEQSEINNAAPPSASAEPSHQSVGEISTVLYFWSIDANCNSEPFA
jgi:hypothetical protein